MKKIKSKSFFDYTKKLVIQGQFGDQKVPMCDFVEYVSDCVGGSELDFVLCFDKRQEDWEFTNKIGLYGMVENVEGRITMALKQRLLLCLRRLLTKSLLMQTDGLSLSKHQQHLSRNSPMNGTISLIAKLK